MDAMCTGVLPLCMLVQHIHIVAMGPEKDVRSPWDRSSFRNCVGVRNWTWILWKKPAPKQQNCKMLIPRPVCPCNFLFPRNNKLEGNYFWIAYLLTCIFVYMYYVCVVCVYVFTCVCRCVHVCMLMWRPDVNIRCLPLALSTIIFETRSPTEPGVHHLSLTGWPASPWDLSISNLPGHASVPGLFHWC